VLDREVEEVVDHQGLGLASLETAGVDHARDHDLDGVDALHPHHRHEDAVPCEELDHQTLDPGRASGRTALHEDVSHPAHLVTRTVEDR
jgi:hypothetical protein